MDMGTAANESRIIETCNNYPSRSKQRYMCATTTKVQGDLMQPFFKQRFAMITITNGVKIVTNGPTLEMRNLQALEALNTTSTYDNSTGNQ